jgi:hypothetical protein
MFGPIKRRATLIRQKRPAPFGLVRGVDFQNG